MLNFINLLQTHYDMTKGESEKIGRMLSTFGKIKHETVQKYIKKTET
jgi:REP element-mobilizing transposase RayT